MTDSPPDAGASSSIVWSESVSTGRLSGAACSALVSRLKLVRAARVPFSQQT